jgi:hypothetical protein
MKSLHAEACTTGNSPEGCIEYRQAVKRALARGTPAMDAK